LFQLSVSTCSMP